MKRTPELTVSDILQVVSWKDVKRALKYHYPTDKSDYTSAFEGLKKLKIKPWPKGKREYLDISLGGFFFAPEGLKRIANRKKLEEFDTEQYYSPSIKRENDKDKQNWSTSFVPWTKIMGMILTKETTEHHTLPEIVAHVIWDITFYGNEAQMKKTGKEMFKRAAKAIKEIKATKKNRTNKANKK